MREHVGESRNPVLAVALVNTSRLLVTDLASLPISPFLDREDEAPKDPPIHFLFADHLYRNRQNQPA